MSRGHDLYGLTTGFVWRRRSECASPAPRQEFGEPAIGPVVDELGQHVGQICFRIDAVQLSALKMAWAIDELPATGTRIFSSQASAFRRVVCSSNCCTARRSSALLPPIPPSIS